MTNDLTKWLRDSILEESWYAHRAMRIKQCESVRCQLAEA